MESNSNANPTNNAIMQKGGTKEPISRSGNKAMEVERPLFETGAMIPFLQMKETLLTPFKPENKEPLEKMSYPMDVLPP